MKSANRWAKRAVTALTCLALLAGCKSGEGPALEVYNPFKPKAASSDREKPADKALVDKGQAAGDAVAVESPAPGKQADVKLATAEDPSFDYNAELLQAMRLERAGKVDEATKGYTELIKRAPKRFEAYHRLALMSEHRRYFSEAEWLYGEALKLEPKRAELHADLGYCLLLQGKLDRAEAEARSAVATAPTMDRYRLNLGTIFGQQGRYDEALGQFRVAESEPEAYQQLASLKESRRDLQGARECYQLALRVDPRFEPAGQALRRLDLQADARARDAGSYAQGMVSR